MEILLNEDVPGLGDMGDRVKVRAGYARNFLIPRGKAVEAQAASAGRLAHARRQIESNRRKLRVGAEDLAATMAKKPLTTGLRVASGGKVFGSIRRKDISDLLAAAGFEIDRRRVLLEEPIRSVGTHTVKVKLHADVIAPITLIVEKLEASKEEEETETKQAKAQIEEAVADASEVEDVELEDETVDEDL